jgi:zinc protease
MVSTPLKASSRPLCHRLANGLTIIAEQVPLEVVSFSLWIGAGSAAEPNEINGMAHFLEHMIFKGTPTLPSGEFERRVEQRGGMTNAATSQDYTYYYITVAPQDFTAIAVDQIDLVLNAAIPEPAFERERQVVLEEIRRSEDNPRRRVFQRAMEVAFPQHPYGRTVLGPATVIESLACQQMRHFHQHWYHPPHITAVAVGNLPVDQMIETIVTQVEERLPRERSPHTAQSSALSLLPAPAFTEVVRQELIDPALQQARLVMFWRVPGMDQLEETYALDILARILGSGRTSRLVMELREQRGWVSSLSVSNMTQALQGLFYISVQLPAENITKVEVAIAQHIRQLQTELVQTTELNQIRRQTANHFIFRNESPANRASSYGYYQTLIGDIEPALNYAQHIQAVTLEDLQSAAVCYLNAEAYGIVVAYPTPSNANS